MAFGDMFKMGGNKQQPANPAAGNPQQGQQPTNQQPQNTNGGNPANTGMNEPGNNGGGGPAANNGPQNNNQNAGNQGQAQGIDRFGKMWDTPSSQGNQPPSFALDPKVLNDVAGQQDFMKGIDPELMQRATGGDVKALMEMMQAVSRNAYRTSIEHAGLLTDKFVGARENYSSKNLASGVRKELTTHALSAVPNFKNPVIQKQLSDTANRLQTMHPDASPQEIAQMTMDYFSELTAAIQDPSKAQNNQQGGGADANKGPKGAEFWDSYFATAAQED